MMDSNIVRAPRITFMSKQSTPPASLIVLPSKYCPRQRPTGNQCPHSRCATAIVVVPNIVSTIDRISLLTHSRYYRGTRYRPRQFLASHHSQYSCRYATPFMIPSIVSTPTLASHHCPNSRCAKYPVLPATTPHHTTVGPHSRCTIDTALSPPAPRSHLSCRCTTAVEVPSIDPASPHSRCTTTDIVFAS
jgi:hypothetical protein